MSEQERSSRRRMWVTFKRNRTALVGVVLAVVVILLAILAPWISPHDPLKQNVYHRLKGPEPGHPLGVDDFGRDVLSRVLWGARTSLVVGSASVLVGLVVGTLLGIVAGFKGGRLEYVIMRAVDVLLSFPTLIMGLMVMAILGSGMTKLILAIGIVMSPRFARVAHGPTLSIREKEFVMAARATGADDLWILRHHILPNILGGVAGYGQPVDGDSDSHRGEPQLHRARCVASDADVGQHDPRWGEVVDERTLLVDVPGVGHPDHGHGVQYGG